MPATLKYMPKIQFQENDGGRADAGRKGITGDCVTRAVAIASGRPYQEVYDRLAEGNATQRKTKRMRLRDQGKRSASNGIYTSRKWFADYMTELGFEWVSVMQVGTGCTTHLRADELPQGRLVVRLSKHVAAVIDGVLHDTYDCSRDGTRCVYGYWKLTEQQTDQPYKPYTHQAWQMPTVPCTWCGTPTTMLGTKHCDGCHELDVRIRMQPELAAKILQFHAPQILQHYAQK